MAKLYREEGMPDLLTEMRYVMDYPVEGEGMAKEEAFLRPLRQSLATQPMAFLDRKAKLEGQFLEWKTQQETARIKELESQSPKEVEEKLGPDGGSQKALRMLEEEWKRIEEVA